MRDFLRLAGLTLQDRWLMLAGVALGSVTIGSSIGLMATSGYLISTAALAPALGDLRLAIVGVRFFGILRGVARYAERCVSHEVTFHLLARLRGWFYRSLEPLAPARLMTHRSGDLQNRIVADIETLEHFFVSAIGPGLVVLLTAALVALIMAAHSRWLAAATGILIVSTAVVTAMVTVRLGRDPGRKLLELRSLVRTRLVESLQGAADLVIYDSDSAHRARTSCLSHQYERQHLKLASARGIGHGLVALGADMCIVIALVISIPMVNAGRIDGVYLAVIVLSIASGFEAVAPIPAAFHALEKCLEASRRLFAIVDTAPPVPEPSVPATLRQPLSLSVRDLWFAYPSAPGVPVLQGIDLDLEPGRKVAVVGPNGAGKSTLMQLLLRFWDYETGSIFASGSELRTIPSDQVRASVGVVSQSTYLFADTVAGNIRLACPDATDAQVEDAARRAGLHNFVLSLPDGYDTWVGELGERLSGGERQRLAIARAVLKDAPMLFLDEPMANLDAVTAASVYQELRDFARKRTVLLITHRLIGLDWLDEIAVMVNGSIAERGSASELISLDGAFRAMHDLQKRDINPVPWS